MRKPKNLLVACGVLLAPCLCVLACGGPTHGSSGTGGRSGVGGRSGTGGVSPNASGGSGGDTSAFPPLSKYIVVDQFGYLPDAEKIAVMRDPETGFDAAEAFTPGASYALVNVATGEQTGVAAPVAWNGGAVDASSGDRAYRFDFSDATAPGEYYVLDVDNQVRSAVFRVADDVYRDVLKQAVRMFFYQRVGQVKSAEYAGAGWADAASHVGPLQDHNARLFNDKANAATERDVWGGWYDAGDLNKYTSWTASYVENLLRAYHENPLAFGDDYGIPESGNGTADVVDEAQWGMDYLTRLQGSDGSLLSIVGEASASPPSAAKKQTLYGSPNTSGTLGAAAAFAYGARIFGELGNASYAADLLERAKKAYAWAEANPAVLFKNNDAASNSSGLGSGQQETNDYGRMALKLDAAVQLFLATGEASYQAFVDGNYTKAHLFVNYNYVSPWDVASQDALLDYAAAAGATASVATAIRAAYLTGAKGSGNLGAITSDKDPYLSYMKDYVWGSNSTKANTGTALYGVVQYGLDSASSADFQRAAARYVHYIHGVNPLSLVYLTNMGAYGAENSINEIYHTWFCDKSPSWDRVGTSTFGPPPGFLAGGPNPSYNWDSCCPGSCGGCGSAALSPPRGQPAQKAYLDFNAAWPLNSWSVTEPSNGYQVAYIRLLSKFVK
ncbi:MAG: glycoside hydrolase family 9 protein [Polyangiaceae bacterium]